MADLDWADVLTPEERRHYERFLQAGLPVTFVHPDRERPWTWTATTITPEPAVLREIERRPTRDGILLRNGYGPDTASSSQELAVSPEWVWDVCGYYRRLGLHWKATKAQIRKRLRQIGARRLEGSADLIYAARQLLDDGIRREYDRTPLGTWFLKDKDTEEAIKRAAQAAASAMAARGMTLSTEDVLRDWGLRATPRGGPEGEGQEPATSRAPSPPPAGPAAHPWAARWSWYADPESKYLMFGRRLALLETWQLLLVRAFAARGIRARFAVGLCMEPGFAVRPAPDPGTLVVLLGSGEPTPEMARDAADLWCWLAEQNADQS